MSGPSTLVLHAFGADEPAVALAGGRGTSWKAGRLVLKPEENLAADILADVVADGVRLGAPRRTREGLWVCEGWSASYWVPGSEPDYADSATWCAIIEAGRAFHRAVAHIDRPGFLDVRRDPWARGDRAAWGEEPMRFRGEFAAVARRLEVALEPAAPAQLVHGDLTRNVLFAEGLPPAVIDVSPYWRPPEYAEGVVVADALCWHGASGSLLDATRVPVAAVARALLFRLATSNAIAAKAAVATATAATTAGTAIAGETADAAQASKAHLRAVVTEEARRYADAATAIGL